MSYSFFGTCADDHDQFFGCLKTIIKQTVLPKEIIIVNSGEKCIKEKILRMIFSKKIKLIYIFGRYSRVKSLNIAIDKSTSKYSFRFDTRTRFSKSYAENSLKLLEDKFLNASVVGGVPLIISNSKKPIAKLIAEIMKSSYVFFFPNHRNINYDGFSSSIYLGCFKTYLLQKIRFNEKQALISEDSLIINDFIKRGFKAYISSQIKVSYISRNSLLNVFKLFNSYGFCRANTILISKKIFISKRHFLVLISILIISFLLIKVSSLNILLFPIILLIFNYICEISFYKSRKNFWVPFYSTLCQFSWILGFLWCLLTILKRNKKLSNFIS